MRKEVNNMLTYKGGNKVEKGTYWELSSGKRIDVANEAILSGDNSSTYLRISAGFMLLAGPVIGLLYVVLLPFIGIATVTALAARKVVGGVFNLVGKSLSFGWRPRTAYLAGKKKKDKKDSK
jgi:hypothetical protein